VTIVYKDITVKLDLSNQIVPEDSSKQATPKKIELKLKKLVENVNWMGIEKGGDSKLLATQIVSQPPVDKPSYPSSSKNKKNWDEINREFSKELANDKPEGDAALNSLFKQIYDRSDEDTRRAMIKSY
jgi:suppressor of G2 allele of SKP1